MEKPAAGHGHLLQVIDPAQTIAVGDEVGKGVQMGNIAREYGGKKGALLGKTGLLPEGATQIVQFHRNLLRECRFFDILL